MEHWVGLDVGVYRTSVCVTDSAGVIVSESEVETEAACVAAALAPYPQIAVVGLETGVSLFLTRELLRRGFPVVMFDAFKASRYLAIRRNKTDANDARGLAEIARLGRLAVSEVRPRNDECQAIRSKLKLRRGIVNHRLAAEGLLRSLLLVHGRTLPRSYSVDGLRRNVVAAIATIPKCKGETPATDILSLLEFCEQIRKYERALGNELERLARRSPVCRRLMTVPGVGPICALCFYSAIEDPHRFKRVENVGAYLGLTPLVRETGGRASRGRVSKAGDAMTRANLYVAARVLMSNGHRDCALTRWASQIKDRIGVTRGRVALARKLAIVMATIWKAETDFVDFPEQAPTGGEPGPR